MHTAYLFWATAALIAFSSEVLIKDIADNANWTSTKTFFLFYHKDLPVKNNNFVTKVLVCWKIACIFMLLGILYLMNFHLSWDLIILLNLYIILYCLLDYMLQHFKYTIWYPRRPSRRYVLEWPITNHTFRDVKNEIHMDILCN